MNDSRDSRADQTGMVRPSVVLLYAEDSQGLGHVNLMLQVARRLTETHAHLMVVLATESPVPAVFSLPTRCDHIKLPTRRPLAEAGVVRINRRKLKARFRTLRRRMLLDIIETLRPDLVLVDHEPVGYDGELREALSALKEQRPASRFVYLMRDVDDDPEFIRNRWTKQQAYEALDDLYDCIAVYGAPAIFDPAETYALSPTARAKLHYCGYIVRDRPEIDARSVRERFGIPVGAPLVVATVGSGSDGYPVLEAVLAALPLLRTRCPELYAIAATGPFMPPAQRDSLACRAGPQDRVLAEATVPELLVAADAAIGMGGYNSVFEALALARPLVIIPRTPRSRQKMEQLLRARALSRLGLARCVAPDELASERVAEALAGALAEDRAALAARIARSIPSFDGAASLVDLLSPWLTPKTF